MRVRTNLAKAVGSLVAAAALVMIAGCGSKSAPETVPLNPSNPVSPSTGSNQANQSEPSSPVVTPADCSTQEPPAAPKTGEALTLTVSKDVARAGEELSITIVGDPALKLTRGVDSYLECWTGKEWGTTFVMILSTRDGKLTPTVAPYTEPPMLVGLGLTGPGPEPVKLPDKLAPGWYRIRKRITVEGPVLDARTLYARIRVEG